MFTYSAKLDVVPLCRPGERHARQPTRGDGESGGWGLGAATQGAKAGQSLQVLVEPG